MAKYYTMQDYLKSDLTIGEMRRLYGGLASSARQKLARLEKAYGEHAQIVREHKGDFKRLSELGKLDRRELAMELAQVSRFHRAKSSKVAGYAEVQAETIENLNAAGFDFVNTSNVEDVLQYLDFMKDMKITRTYGSVYIIDALMDTYGQDKTVDAISRAVKRGLTNEQLAANVERWLENIEDVKEGRKRGALQVRTGKGRNS